MKQLLNNSQANTDNRSLYITMLKALVMCFTLSLIMVVAYAVVLSYSTISEESMPNITQFIVILSITIAGIYGGRRVKRKGWLFGAALGILYIILLMPITIAFGQKFVFDIYFILKILMGCAVGLIGGVIGVNLS